MRIGLICTRLSRNLALKYNQSHLKIQLIFSIGGTILKYEIMCLYQPVHFHVGTLEIILEIENKGVCNLKYCTMFVMDEADKILPLEFEPLVEKLIKFLPKTHQILLFSTTFLFIVKSFKDRFFCNPYMINLMDELTLKGIP
jgi:ATP-dependent RNA helicase DDX6/DHH1